MINFRLFETDLQKATHIYLSDPSRVFFTKNNDSIQILSQGKLNVNEGPDFLEIALLIRGKIIIGDAEFHKNSIDWDAHNHSNDHNYDNVILHIVLEEHNKPDLPFNTLIIKEDELLVILNDLANKKDIPNDLFSLEELQNYALIRLLRKATDAQKLLNNYGLNDALVFVLQEFLDKYKSRRRRPVYDTSDLKSIVETIGNSHIYKFLEDLSQVYPISIPDAMMQMLKTKIANEGAALRREIILNCVLPLSLTIANEDHRINLLVWYWSTPALNKYGILSRRFVNIPQNYLWQQQYMLEYINDNYKNTSIISDAINQYSIGNFLTFLQIGIKAS
jgi:hypothetical protein